LLAELIGMHHNSSSAAGPAHDPEKCAAVFPRDKRERVCAEIMRKH
jgi:hypothetical protein